MTKMLRGHIVLPNLDRIFDHKSVIFYSLIRILLKIFEKAETVKGTDIKYLIFGQNL